ncbi:restriction endonuclease subunit S [Marinobacter sp.]|uniref:restriction endonuclease subunit S n=1 Tax=Marinobacter sp. TaxID=50741 RepID=UPI003A939E85
MTLPAYPRYKDSGVHWIGSVPEHWNISRLRNIFLIQKRIAGKLGLDVLSITNKGVKVKDITSGDGQLSNDYSKYQLVLKGDFAMNHMDLLTGYVDISAFDGVTSPDYRVFSLKHPQLDSPRYLLRLLQNAYHQKLFFPFGQGSAHLGRWRLPTEEFKDFFFPRPSHSEQDIIAAFLDHETAKIDALIREQERLIELLQEKRQAVISHAVTKGLDPDVSMKDSGVGWLGEVPSGWKLGRLKHLLRICGGRDYKAVESNNPADYPVIGSGGQFIYAVDYLYDGESVLLGRKGTIDKPLYVKGKFWTVDTMFYTEVLPGTSGRYAYYLAMTIPFGLYSTNTALPSMSQFDLANHELPLPPFTEQTEIALLLDEQTAKLDALIWEAKKSIEIMTERRSALTSAAVTGKIDVRDWRPPADERAFDEEVRQAGLEATA